MPPCAKGSRYAHVPDRALLAAAAALAGEPGGDVIELDPQRASA